MLYPKETKHRSIQPIRFHLSTTKDIPVTFFRKTYPKYLFTIDLKQWESLSKENLTLHINLLKAQKYVQALKIPVHCYNNKYFSRCLKHFWLNCGHIDAQFAQPSSKKCSSQRFNKRIKSLCFDSSAHNLKPIKAFRNLKTLQINSQPETNTISNIYFQKLSKILSRLSRLETCFLLSIRSNESNIKEITQLVSHSKTPTKFIAEFNDVPLSNLTEFRNLKDRLKVHAKVSAIDIAITPDFDFTFLHKLDISLRFGLNITDVSHMNFLHYMSNLHVLTLSFRFKDLPISSINDLFRIIKLPKQLTSLSLELNDLQLIHKPFKQSPQNLLKNLDSIEEALEDLRTDIPTKNLMGEFEGLKHLQSLKLLFSGEQDNPLFHLLTYAAVRCMPNLNEVNVIIELSRNYNFMNQIYYELNFTYLLTLLQHPEKLKQILLSVPIIAFRKVPQRPKLPDIEKVFLHYSKDPGDLEEYEEYAERVFQAISETHVKEIYINFASGLFNDEWLKIFIDIEGFSRVEKVFISSGTDLVDEELLEAFCFFLNEKKLLSKLILNLLKCNISNKSMTTCLEYVKDAKKLLYTSITTKKVSLVDNKMKNVHYVIKDLMV